jgi:hypothetical protein
MRFALIAAFVGSVLFTTNVAAAHPGAHPAAQARKTPKAQKRRAHHGAAKAKSTAKATKVSRKAKAKPKAEEVAVADDDDASAPAAEVDEAPVAPVVKGAPVAQATDDEDPPSGAKKKR